MHSDPLSAPVPNLRKAYWALMRGDLLGIARHLFGYGRLEQFLFMRQYHRRHFGSPPPLFRPQRFRDRLLHIMLARDGHSPLRARVTDKEHVKAFVAERLGENLTPRTIAVFDSVAAFASASLPDHCAIKATHDSGSVLLRRGPGPVDLTKIETWLRTNYYSVEREPNYRNLQPKILVEELLSGPDGREPVDYKFFCFHGVPAFVEVDVDRFTEHKQAFLSLDWQVLDFVGMYRRPEQVPVRPRQLERMIEIARKLSQGFSFIRVDLYELPDRVLVGELTNFPRATMLKYEPDDADFAIGSLFDNPHQDVRALLGTVQRG